MNVVFLAPDFPSSQRQFVRALAESGSVVVGIGESQLAGYSGADELRHRYGEWIIDAQLPPPGTGTRAVEAGYLANAYLRMRHPDYDTLHAMLDDVGRTLHVYAA